MLANENLLPPLSSLPQLSEQVKRANDSLHGQSVATASLSTAKSNADGSKGAETGIVFAFGKLHSQQSIDAKTATDNNTLFSVTNALLPLKFFLRDDFITSVACGDEHSAFISNTGRVFVIGRNNMGQLGLDLPVSQTLTRPTCIKSLKADRVYRVGCGAQHTLLAAETSNGKKRVLAFGANSDLQLGIGRNAGEMCSKPQIVLDGLAEDVVMLSGGRSHSALVLSDMRLLVWGGGPEGQLGLGDQIIESDIPVQLNPPAGFSGFLAVSCGYYHTLVITSPPALFACGETENGKLGVAETTDYVSDLKHVDLGAGEQVSAISAGGNHSFAVTTKGRVYAMGSGTHGQLGVGTSVSAQSSLNRPSLLKSFADGGIIVRSVSAGESHSAFVTDDGRMFLCGNALHARLGFDVSANSFTPRLANLVDEGAGHDVTFLVTSVACGGCHTVCLANKSTSTTKPFNDTTNFGTASSLFTASSARMGRRQRRSAAQSLTLSNQQNELQPLQPSGISKSLSNLPPLKPSPSIVSTVPMTVDSMSLTPVSTLTSDPATTVGGIEQTTTMAMAAALNSAPPKLESTPVVVAPPVQPVLQPASVVSVSAPVPAEPIRQQIVSPPDPPATVTPVPPETPSTTQNPPPEVTKLDIPDSTRTEDAAKTPETKVAQPVAKKSSFSLPLICGNKKPTAAAPTADKSKPAGDANKPNEPEKKDDNKPETANTAAAAATAPTSSENANKTTSDAEGKASGETKTTNAAAPTKTCTVL